MKKTGFTLVELLVVIGIIAVLVTLSMVGVNLAKAKARTAKALHDIDVIYQAIATLANDTNSWPGHQTAGQVCSSSCAQRKICGQDSSSATCNFGVSDTSSGIIATDALYGGWSGPYMPSMPIDPWNHEYFFYTDYRVTNADNQPCGTNDPVIDCRPAVVVGSYGPDGLGAPANVYGADDIIKIIK